MELPISNSLKALDVMVEAETAVAEFYSLCSEQFTEHTQFWSSLAKEEFAHAEVIRKLIHLVRIQPAQFTAGKSTPLEAVKAFVARTRSNIESMRRGDLPEDKALFIAYHIENIVIEAQYADVVSTENDEYKALLDQVLADTLRHKESVLGETRALKRAQEEPDKRS
jgi:hypothetical protein